ncbi:uncharacterized protein LOC141656267 [Silene latifolia]|uniref:uncharacterized protein LOC141656267 n=1 Tax=Silene latifolia TaxID=37657 RepID=UPI003D76DAD6
MIISSWNIRGFNDPIKQHEVRGYLSRNKVEVFGLLETTVKIWVFLDTIRVTLISSYGHDQLVHLELLHHISNKVIHVSFVYGSNDAGHRERLWGELIGLKSKVTNWILMGDWNIVRDMEERIGSNPPSVTEVLAINQSLLDCQLDDLHNFGCEFTWTNKRETATRIWSILDRVVANSLWLAQFPTTQDQHQHKRRFSYLNCWEEHQDYVKVMKQAWDVPVKGNAIHRLFSKLKNVKIQLINIHKTSYSGISEKVKVAHQQLHDCQLSLQTKPLDCSLLALEQTLLQTYLALKKAEKSSLTQRAKIQDIKYKDAPTSHSFARIAARKHQMAFGQQTPVDTTLMDSLGRPKISGSGWMELCRDIYDKEIQTALFSIASNKSPGQDGFSAQFFKTSWNTIKHKFCTVVKGFFTTGNMPKQANTTLLALISKKPFVSTVMDYRPIAYCIVFYKIVSKILCSKLKPFLPDIVGKNKGYGQQVVSPRCLIKVDIRKAFDSLQWEFIGKMLHYFNFPEKFQRWIMGSITSTWFSLKVNGDHIGFFKGASGLKQSDPLSPFLFVMSMEILSRVLRGIHQQHQKKTNIYMAGIRGNIKQEILTDTGYTEGQFPFRYLGVPLNEGKLNKTMFADLITKKKPTHSESWRSILQVRDELLAMAGNGTNAENLLSACVKKGCIQLSLLYDQFRRKGNPIS